MSAQTPVFRLIDYAEALDGPYMVPPIDLADLQGWSNLVLQMLQHRMVSRAYGLHLLPPRAMRAELNAPIHLSEVIDAAMSAGHNFSDLLVELRRLHDVEHDRQVAASGVIERELYLAMMRWIVRELERRHGERGRPLEATLH